MRCETRRDRSGEHSCVLEVESLGEEHRPQPERLRDPHLVEQVTRGVAVPRQAVAAELGERLVHPKARSTWPWMSG